MQWREPISEIFNKTFGAKWFYFQTLEGSHHVYYNSLHNKTAIVPVHGNKDIKKGTFLAILKQTGIDISL